MTFNKDVAKLVIAEASAKDEGQYSCRVENDAGKVQTKARLFVEGE